MRRTDSVHLDGSIATSVEVTTNSGCSSRREEAVTKWTTCAPPLPWAHSPILVFGRLFDGEEGRVLKDNGFEVLQKSINVRSGFDKFGTFPQPAGDHHVVGYIDHARDQCQRFVNRSGKLFGWRFCPGGE